MPKVPTWRPEQDSNPRHFGRKTSNQPMRPHAPQCVQLQFNLPLRYPMSSYHSVAVAWSKVRSDTCGLLGSVGVVTRADREGRLCQGTLSDWDSERTCSSQARLRLQLRGNCDAVTNRLRPTRRTHPTPHHPTHVEGIRQLGYYGSAASPLYKCLTIK